ncbi:zinc finger protein 106 isoform X1 [Cyprinodon tularosa]|uniref:zinc finger protein 106 isoform X1 n=1 Tax=Cyprinodon tularosa TaxID=77115 RepID=UPI0018E27747|nr:zinc finger protein 106 isoform X1 [Cyprinodon tularosa]XP_038135418.1 zinc finger protein 106 isoform X1 [Cyprinodon tularosa]
MMRNRQCVLCEIVCSSKQDMDEHMRSMLHHRELEKLKGRDCGHECRVCKVNMASLTDYASHISGPTHKQNVEAAVKQQNRDDQDEEYFDQTLVELIQKRKEQIRKEKEAAAAKLAKEEEERKRKEEFQQRLNKLKERYFLERQASQQGFNGPRQHNSWHRRSYHDGRTEGLKPLYQNQQGKSATWHAQEAPGLQRWATMEFSNERGDGSKTRGNGSEQSRLPWLCSGGSSNGLYGHNNIARYASQARPHSFLGPRFLGQAFNHFGSRGDVRRGQQDSRYQKEEASPADSDHHGKNSKTLGSNPKLDKSCRWSPYPVVSGSHGEMLQNTSETLLKPAQSDPKPGDSGVQSVEEKKKHPLKQRLALSDSKQSSEPRNRTSQQEEQKSSSVPETRTVASSLKSKPIGKQIGSKVPVGYLTERQEKFLPEVKRSVRQIGFERRSSIERTTRPGEQQLDHRHNQSPPVKDKHRSSGKASPPVVVRQEKAPPSSTEDNFVQSLQVSTSNTVSTEPAASEPAASVRKEEESGDGAERRSSSGVQTEAGQSSESDTLRSSEAQMASGSDTSALSKLDLPPVLKRDLTKHMSSKSKATGHEPNLNIARRVRNLSESRRSDAEKDSGLKPTVRQLINSSGPRRSVNWEQVYQEVRKKQDKGKGMPRFGIEMVPLEQESQNQGEDGDALLEGFQWESLMEITAESKSRKRSLSESSLTSGIPHPVCFSLKSEETVEEQESLPLSAPEKPDKLAKVLQPSDSALGDSSSGTEQCDGQGTGKRRRAAGDSPSMGASSLEGANKRRKIKPKKERLQIDQLLAVSLREEELSQSLQKVDANLIQARAALEAAYLEVQRLMVVKQQMTVEMSTLRNKRIELLKGMQGATEEAPELSLKLKDMADFGAELSEKSSTAGCSPNHSAECASPPSSTLPQPVVIKEEPQSPVCINLEPDPYSNITSCAHSTTAELQNPSADPVHSLRMSPGREPEPQQTNTEDPPACKEKLSAQINKTERSPEAWSCNSSKTVSKSSPTRRGSELPDTAVTESLQSTPAFILPDPPLELRSGRRVRKLKKRKVLKKAQGVEQFQSSDTEMDEEASRPRWMRQRRRPSGGSQFSTSSLPTDEGSKRPSSGVKANKRSDAKVALPQENLDVEGSMEVSAACQQPQEDAFTQATPPPAVPGPIKSEPHSLACNEVSSTSDMDLCKSSESDLSFPVTLPRTSSDAFSDHGEDDMPTEGTFHGHQEAVNALQIHNGLLYTCSGDRTIKAFDLVSHKCVGVFEGHSSKVTCLLVSVAPSLHHRLYSGSSDQTIRCYSLKTQEFEQQFQLSDRVLCLHSRWKMLYAGLANGTVVTFNLRTNKQMDTFECHGPRAVSCLASSQEGARRILLVGSYDSTISVRDAHSGLLLRTLKGHIKGVLCMKVVNDLVISGSSDRSVHTHNIHTGELVHSFKGHSHGVTVVTALGKVMVTACLDKLVRVYDLQTQDQLQVYGGYSDMVLCMAIHKNMIYTGCYDGSVQSVKLNMMKNNHCWWHGCPLVFGMSKHLQQHLINDHTATDFQAFKCRWKKCEEFFSARSSSNQMVILHMQKHAEEEPAVES